MIEKSFGFEIYGITDSMRVITGGGGGGGGRWCGDFRMRSETFDKLIHTLTPLMQKPDTVFGPEIPVEKRVASGIWRLVAGNSYHTVAKTFAVGKSTAVVIPMNFVVHPFK